jgi:predicted lipoprotein with Yx(FWY)xxD motif
MRVQEQEIKMNRFQTKSFLAIGVCLAAAIGLVACGSSDNSSDAASTSTIATAGGSGGSGDVALGDSGLGQILVDSKGMTLYLFEKDTSGDASTCSGACAQAWPPMTVKGTPEAGDGVDASKLTTLKRDDGTTQIAYNGHPLYYYAGDSAPGDITGSGLDQFGAEWYAVTAAGESAEGDSGSSDDSSSSGDTTSSDSSAGGYSY